MKYLSHYTEKTISKVLEDNGAFFAFSNEQFEENKKEGVNYCNLYGGMIAPKENVNKILKGLEKAHEEGIEQDIKENSMKDIIWREFGNYECQISGDIEDALSSLKDYPITEDIIIQEFQKYMKHCIKNDLF